MRLLLVFLLILPFILAKCQTPLPAPIEERADPAAISWDQIKEAMDYCKTNGKVKKVYVTGKVICNNNGRFFISVKKDKK